MNSNESSPEPDDLEEAQDVADEKLVLSQLHTDFLLPDERLDVWRASCSHIFDANVRSKEEQDAFFAKIRGYNLGELVVIDSKSVGQAFRRDTRLRMAEELDHFLVQLYLVGGYFGEHAGREIHVRPGDIGVIDMAWNLKTETTGDQFRCLSVFIPRPALLAVLPAADNLSGAVVRGDTPMGRLLKAHLLSVWEVLPDTRNSEVATVTEALLSLMTVALQPEAVMTPQMEQARNQAHLVQIQDYIEANLTFPELKAEHLCKAFSCSRSHLYRLFEHLGGISGYITERRLERAYRELARGISSKGRISEVAFSLGFNSQSHFSRLFRKHFAVSPSDVIEAGRVSAHLEEGKSSPLDGREGLPDWHHWIRGL